MTVLRIYDPVECNTAGVPLDWERCRTCEGSGMIAGAHWADEGYSLEDDSDRPCPRCEGHGSLKAAALAELARIGRVTARCEGCGHPMNDGTWDPPREGSPVLAGLPAEASLAEALHQMRASAGEPEAMLSVYYSPCDEECRHGMDLRVQKTGGGWHRPEAHEAHNAGSWINYGWTVEASWRPVDVRTLGWPMDLRPEKLAVLCLRCWAAR